MNNFVEKASDVNVTGELLYIMNKPDSIFDGHLYVDKECNIKANAALLKHLFEMDHAVIVGFDLKIRPIYLTTYDNKAYVSIACVVESVSDETVARIMKFYSSEYVVTEADIKTFTIATGTVVIDEESKTIAVAMPKNSVVTALKPTFTISKYAKIKVGTEPQISGVTANNFTNPVTYVVTAEDGVTINEWIVTVTVATE